jgi:hypothetical protein
MSSTTLTTPASSLTTTKQKVGLSIAGFFSLINIPSFLSAPDTGEVGPPMPILVLTGVLGVIGLIAVVMAWRGNRVALRVAAGAIIVSTLTGLPAFFVDVPMFVKALVAFSVLLTVLAVVLMFSGDRRPASISD